jgi:hypothetical protein
MQSLFHGRVGMPKELLQQMNAKHHLVVNGGRPFLPAGASGAISHSNCGQGITKLISSRNSRMRVRLVTSSNPVVARLICFI